MLNIPHIREKPGTILVLGNYRPAIQATLDFDFMSGKDTPSIVGIVTSTARFQKYFYGKKELLIPCFSSAAAAADQLSDVNWMLNVNSGRRALASTNEFFAAFPDAAGGHIFAEDVPELHALELYKKYQQAGKVIVGTAGVGLIVPGYLKLGVVGGIDSRQLQKNHLAWPGSVAVLSASGGMINELITMVASSGHGLSFALCFGGDRFPLTSPKEAFLAAENDRNTKTIVYYGELGGTDEYEIAELIAAGQITKPIFAYIAGVIGERFEAPIQFGHAKALAGSKSETASAKRRALQNAGAHVASSIGELKQQIAELPTDKISDEPIDLSARQASLFTSTISAESADGYEFVGRSLQAWAAEGDIALQITSALLGRLPKSKLTSDFVREIYLLSIDHGPQVSGALNTIITARAGKNLVDSLAAGLMSVGPRFGGAVSGAAREWLDGVHEKRDPSEHIENYARAKKYIQGIGHKKYRLGFPDPRVARLSDYAGKLRSHPHFDYAKQIEAITTSKKGSLILNVDGTIAAIMLDILMEKEAVSHDELTRLIDADFFNALFVIPRIVGFTAHYLDQKRLDEGLFRLPDNDVLLA